jgi:hypothetical protein
MIELNCLEKYNACVKLHTYVITTTCVRDVTLREPIHETGDGIPTQF